MEKKNSRELEWGIFILFISMNLFNLFSLIFHFSMGRMLGPAAYGTLVVLISFINIYGVPSEAISNFVTKYASKLNANNRYGEMNFIFKRIIKKTVYFSILLFVFAMILSIWISDYLKIGYWALALTNLIIFAMLLGPSLDGMLQGRKKFSKLGIRFIAEGVIKLGLSLILVSLGFGIFGAVGGILCGAFIAILLGFYFNRDILRIKEKPIKFKGIYKESAIFLLVSLVIMIIFSFDIIIAKRFFSPEITGQYAAISTIAKMIFLGTIAIGKGMFPLTSEKEEKKEDSRLFLKKSLWIICGICVICLFVFYFFPDLLINILYGKDYLAFSSLLFYMGISIVFLSISNLILLYGLSTSRIKNYLALILLPISEILILYLFNSTIEKYVLAFMFFNIIMFISIVLFFIKWKKES